MTFNRFTFAKPLSFVLLLFSPVIFGCSVFSGSSSNDPMVNAQQTQINTLEDEVRAQKRRTDEAEQLYKRERDLLKAKKSELKAAERLLNVYEKQAKQN
jgi:hypothetical protein